MKHRNIALLPALTVFVLGLALLSLMSCASVGREFSSAKVTLIKIGQTEKSDLVDMFGSPWRTGIEDGRETWTYGKYTYRLFGESSTKDLVIWFDDKGVVKSYSFNTTEHEVE